MMIKEIINYKCTKCGQIYHKPIDKCVCEITERKSFSYVPGDLCYKNYGAKEFDNEK